jgi:hypothetical protein
MATPEYQQIKESMKSAFLFRQILDSKEAAQRSGQISGQRLKPHQRSANAQGFRCPPPETRSR